MESLEPDFNCSSDHEETTAHETNADVKVKKEKAKQEKKARKSIFESGDISSYGPSELVSLFQKHAKKAFPGLSDLELCDVLLTERAFGKGSGANGSLGEVENFFVSAVPQWKGLDSHKPVCLIISSSAIRCTDVLRALPAIRNRCSIAKLFAKHIKLPEQKAFLRSHDCPVAIGTPARILKLAQEEDLPIDLSLVELVLVDTHKDGKDRTVFDVAEIRKELLELLCRTSLRDRLNSQDAQIHFF